MIEIKEISEQLSWLYEINSHGKAFLSPRIRKQIISAIFTPTQLKALDDKI